jgi:hypothetical protein
MVVVENIYSEMNVKVVNDVVTVMINVIGMSVLQALNRSSRLESDG